MTSKKRLRIAFAKVKRVTFFQGKIRFTKNKHTHKLNTKFYKIELFIMNYNTKKQVYIKIYNHSLSKATIVAASVIKSSTTLSNTRSTSKQRKSSETKLGETFEHDDWKIRVSKYNLSSSNIMIKKGEKGKSITT